MASGLVPGMLAVTRQDGVAPSEGLASALSTIGVEEPSTIDVGGVALAGWGFDLGGFGPGTPVLLSLTNWRHNGSVDTPQIARWLDEGASTPLGEMLPPFAALGAVDEGVRVAADQMGFRQIYYASGASWSAVSTSARALAALGGGGFNLAALKLQSQLGWQLGQSTLFRGVTKLAPGEVLTVTADEMRRERPPEPPLEPITLDEAVRRASRLLREFLERYLDESPDPTLQLTGGQDSRILLSAIPRRRRHGLKVMTVDAPGTGDAELAAHLSGRFGLRHTVQSLDGLAHLSPAQCFESVCEAASRLDCMADPLARAATLWAERSLEQGARLSGLGGEIARGFYYTGRVTRRAVTKQRSERLARWRMFANEPVEQAAISPELARDAVPVALESVYRALVAGNSSWFEATDELYYRHRMQRWAGLGETAVCLDRSLTNPMLDDRFLAIARALSPRDKQGSVFLARLQLELDEELASIPLDNRPPPRVYADPGSISSVRIRAATLRRAAKKARQRLLRTARPPAGAAVVARGLSQHIRENHELLDPVRDSGAFDEQWLDGVAAGRVEPSPGSLALLANVLVACRQPSG